jgi:hypothetical protein
VKMLVGEKMDKRGMKEAMLVDMIYSLAVLSTFRQLIEDFSVPVVLLTVRL